MGYGTGKKDMPTVNLGTAMAGKKIGGGVNLSPKMMDESQRNVSSGKETKMENSSMAKSGIISGGHPKGGFMKKSKSYSPTKGQGYNDRQDESLGMKDGKESSKKQSMKDRRDEREGENKAQGNDPDGLTKYPKNSMPKSKKGPHKDYDGDGKQESSTQEYLGSVDKAIKANKK